MKLRLKPLEIMIFGRLFRNMQNIENSDYESPKDLKTELRPYQIRLSMAQNAG